MSPSPPAPDLAALAALQDAALAPLRFASRHNFANLDRVAQLEATLQQGIQRLERAVPLRDARDALAAIRASLPPSDASRAVRVVALSDVLARLAAWQPSEGSAPDDASSPASDATVAVSAAIAKPSPVTSRPPSPSPFPSAAPLSLSTPLASLRGVGERTLAQLAQRDLTTVEDLLRFAPRRFRSRQGVAPISDVRQDTLATVEGQVMAVRDRYARGRRSLEVALHDGTGTMLLVWFRMHGRGFADQFIKGARFAASGSVRRHRQFLQMAHPEVRRVEDVGTLPFGSAEVATPSVDDPAWAEDAIVPLYLDIEGLHPHALRRLIARALPACATWSDPLPVAQRRRRDLCSIGEAYQALHQPPPGTDPQDLEARADPWHRRLIYEELFFLQLGLLQRRFTGAQTEHAVALPASAPRMVSRLADVLPFVATAAQVRAIGQVDDDCHSTRPMQRLLQGDVGSGKTAVAFCAARAMLEMGQQVALMAPTELLAEQHARNAQAMLKTANLSVTLLTSSVPTRDKRLIVEQLAGGVPMLAVGTHALIAQQVAFARLGLAIIDEQHRFGVLQRARLRDMGLGGQGRVPHMLVMTATPIPRTLAMTVYGELDVSVLDELPPGRKPIHTQLYTERQRAQAYARVRRDIEAGRQAYVVFPLVEASDKEGMEDIAAATEGAAELASGPLAGLRLALLHGRVPSDQKDGIMQRFANGEIDVLIATTVVEVGIDVANASVIVIEHAERFGLSQLHQLRGRVGRGEHDSACLLIARNKASVAATRRLHVLVESNDGFRIAEEDLQIRGPGDFVGTRQSGLPMLSLADLTRDGALLTWARQDARTLLADDPTLQQAAHAPIRQRLAQVWQHQQPLLDTL